MAVDPQAVTNPETPHPARSCHRRRRRWRWLAAVPLLLFLLALLSPYFLAVPAIRAGLMALLTRDLHGQVQVGDLSLGWFSPIAVRDLQISLPDGPPVVELPLLAGNKPLWQVVSSRTDVDHFRLEGAKLNLVFGPDGRSNLDSLLPPREQLPKEEARKASWRRFGGQLEIVDAAFSVSTPKTTQPWGVRGINLTVALYPQTAVPDSSPVVVLERGTLLSHTPISREMCNDALKFIAPVLANVTWAEGDISVDIDRCRLPIDIAQEGDIAGRLSIHKVEAGASPLVSYLAALLGVSARVSLAKDSVVRFELRDGRVYHRDLEVGLENAKVRTSGSVGLDHTLDLIADVPIPLSWLSDRPVVQALSEQRVTLKVRGTLEKPEIDTAGLGRSGIAAVLKAVQQARGTDESGAEGTGLLGGQGGNDLVEKGVAAGAEVLGQWLQNRAEGQRLFPNGILGRRRQGRDEKTDASAAEQVTPPTVELQPSIAPPPAQPSSDKSSATTEPETATSEAVTANRQPLEDKSPPERRRFRLFDRRRERRDDTDSTGTQQ